MKKNLFWIFSLCFMMICLSSCNFGGNENHTHTGGAATCQSPAVCADCGQTYGTVTGHNYGDWVVTKKATLEAAGVRTKSCDYCEDKINDAYSFENSQNAGIDAIDIDVLGDIYSFSVSYESDYVTLSIISDSEIYLDSFEVYFSGYGSNELIEGQAYKLVFSLDDYDFGEHLYLYSNMEFKTLISSNFE